MDIYSILDHTNSLNCKVNLKDAGPLRPWLLALHSLISKKLSTSGKHITSIDQVIRVLPDLKEAALEQTKTLVFILTKNNSFPEELKDFSNPETLMKVLQTLPCSSFIEARELFFTLMEVLMVFVHNLKEDESETNKVGLTGLIFILLDGYLRLSILAKDPLETEVCLEIKSR